MSLPHSHVRCTRCDYEGVLQHRPIVVEYRLPDGNWFTTGRSFGWCLHCDGVRDIETKSDPALLRERIAAITQARSSPGKWFADLIGRLLRGGPSDEKKKLARLKLELEFAEMRLSKPRCLTCGNQGALTLEFEGTPAIAKDVTHACGGRLKRIDALVSAPRFSYRIETIVLDGEGNRLDTQPASDPTIRAPRDLKTA